MQSALIHSGNGHNKTSMLAATELPLVKQLPEERETARSPNSALCTAEDLLQTLLSSDWLESSAFSQFLQKVQEFTKLSAKTAAGISILLLDAENLKLDINTETFLASLCKYPLQVKIAFANWRNPTIGKQDAELYERGYQLVHVPGGKDSADAKMIAFGSDILRQYRTVKEIFVCSCDGILTHLCNQLQNQGLTVYWVRRQNRTLKVENRNTGSHRHYSLAMEMEIPSFEEFVQKTEELINAEQESIAERLSKLSTIAHLLQERSNLPLYENRSNVSPGSDREQDKIISIVKAESTQPVTEKEDVTSNASATKISTLAVTSINSKEELEQALIGIIAVLKEKSPHENVSVVNLSKELHKLCGEPARSIVKKLKLGANFTKFLQSCPTFKLNNTGKAYEVAIR
jgi:hypothetical protein